MIAFFPGIYEDELVYSVLARYYEKTGYMTYRSVVDDLYRRNTITVDAEYINPLTDEACGCLKRQRSMDEIIMKHTMFPYYARFYSKEKRNRIYHMFVTQTEKCCDLLKQTNYTDRFLQFCPMCVTKDREIYGETYWHRAHQIPHIKICPTHKCRLHSSTMKLTGSTVATLATAESMINACNAKEIVSDDLEINLAEYFYDVLRMDMDLESDVLAGDFLDSRLDGTIYKSMRGQQRNISLFTKDYVDFYKKYEPNTMCETSQVQKIFTNNRFNTFEVCLLAFFLKIPSAELVHMVMPAKSQQELFDKKIKQLHRMGMNYAEISRQLNASYDVVKLIGMGKYQVSSGKEKIGRASCRERV